MFGRAPAGFEQAYWSHKLGDGSLTKAQMVDELRCREEFRKATDIMISHKSIVGNWETMADILGSPLECFQCLKITKISKRMQPFVSFNQTLQGNIDSEGMLTILV